MKEHPCWCVPVSVTEDWDWPLLCVQVVFMTGRFTPACVTSTSAGNACLWLRRRASTTAISWAATAGWVSRCSHPSYKEPTPGSRCLAPGLNHWFRSQTWTVWTQIWDTEPLKCRLSLDLSVALYFYTHADVRLAIKISTVLVFLK